MPAKRTKDVVEMFGEFFREAAVLVPVFFFPEYAIKYDGKLSLNFVLIVTWSLDLACNTGEYLRKGTVRRCRS